MYGSNYHGQAYYGQGPAVGTTFILHTVSAAVFAIASVSFKLLINHSVSATVTAVASIHRQFNRSVSTSVTAIAAISSIIVEGLNIRRASTALLNFFRRTRELDGINTTKQLNLVTTTKIITTDE